MKRHELVNIGEKWDVCDYACNQLEWLNNHKILHRGECEASRCKEKRCKEFNGKLINPDSRLLNGYLMVLSF